MKRIAAACLALATLAGCGATRDQLKQATYDCRDRNYDAPEAITACDRLLSQYQAPEQRAVYLAALGTAYGRVDRTEEAIAELTAALEISPGLTNARLERAKIEEKLGDVAAARADYDQVLAEGPWIVDALVGRARLDIAAGDYRPRSRT